MSTNLNKYIFLNHAVCSTLQCSNTHLLSNRARSVTSFPLPSPGDVVLCSSNQARSSSSGAKSGRGDLSKGNGEKMRDMSDDTEERTCFAAQGGGGGERTRDMSEDTEERTCFGAH